MAKLVSDRDLFERIVHHVFLPPQLPQKEDGPDINCQLFKVTAGALLDFGQVFRGTRDLAYEAVTAAHATLACAYDCHDVTDGHLKENILLERMEHLPLSGTLALQVRAQNAGLLMTRNVDGVCFEVFELAPTNEEVISTAGRLIRQFPGFAMRIPSATFAIPEFRSTIAQTLAKMSGQTAHDVQPQIRKGGQVMDETRDTTHPAMVSEFLMGYLMAHGCQVDDSFISIRKNIHDEILFFEAANPWRRSPAWTLIRVVLELMFVRAPYLKKSNSLYKSFLAFLMAKLLQTAQRLEMPLDLQFAMSAKVARRLQHLTNSGAPMLTAVQKLLNDVQNDCSDAIAKTWQEMRHAEFNPCAAVPSLADLHFLEDCAVQLPELEGWLASRSSRHITHSPVLALPENELGKRSSFQFPDLTEACTDDYYIANLLSFEDWCRENLRNCVKAYDVETVCSQVYNLIAQYHDLARSQYDDSYEVDGVSASSTNPEGLSSMILTILELWQTMDEKAVEECPLLAKYDPQMHISLLQNLILLSREQMHRLERVETYLVERRSQAQARRSSDLFGDAEDEYCFAVQFYAQSSFMQQVYHDIIARGEADRARKLEDLQRKLREYAELGQKAASMECTFYDVDIKAPHGSSQLLLKERRHDEKKCTKCRLADKRNKLYITVHEWPLPSRTSQAQAVIFELCIPAWYAKWRDATAYVLQDVLELSNTGGGLPKNHYALHQDPHVGKKAMPKDSDPDLEDEDLEDEEINDQRITLWTRHKSHLNTHRKTVLLSVATEDKVCIKNGTHYQYFDTYMKQFVGKYQYTDKAARACTYSFSSSAKDLQIFMFRPADSPNGQSSNYVIANQSLAPPHMASEEYKELCTLPFGHRTQWYNILLQLAAPNVDFKKEVTALLFLQCIFQAGQNWPNRASGQNLVARASHSVLSHADLAHKIIENLNIALARVKGNWESMHALVVFTAVATKLLTLNKIVHPECLLLLQKVRETAFKWLQTLRSRTLQADDHVERMHFLAKGIEIALVCGSTFDVDSEHLVEILDDAAAVSILVQCAITIAERFKSKKSLLAFLAARFKRVLYRSWPIIRGSFTHSGLNNAIKSIWKAYPAQGSRWRPMRVDYWLQTEITSQSSPGCTDVRYNLLTGELLVDGLRHKTPPMSYEKHATFKALFGDSSVEVVFSRMQGMNFSTKGTYGGYDVHIGITERNAPGPRDLLVVATREQNSPSRSEALEILPSRLLHGYFPELFTAGHVHWYDAQDGTIQFRSLETPWDGSSSANWMLSRSDKGLGWQLRRRQYCIMPSRCRTSIQISQVLSPLIQSPKIHITLQPSGGSVEIEIPSMQLGFTLLSGRCQLHSKEYRGMIIDDDQKAMTLIGLSNKLVLKPLKEANRLLLIPAGEVSYERFANHVSARIDRRSLEKVDGMKIHSFQIDERLGRLVDSGSLQSKLYIAYLHAITSFALPDPLTRKTGTEQALSILRSAAVRSFEQLSSPNIEMLRKIAELTPGRSYYPPDALSMQTVTWDPHLSFMAQHGDFYQVVKDLYSQAEASKIFYPETSLQIPALDHVAEPLLSRDLLRTAVFRVAQYGAEHFTTDHDVEYKSRDHGQDSDRTANAFIMSSIISLHSDRPHWATMKEEGALWNMVKNLENLYGAARPLPKGMMRYDAQFMRGSGDHVAPYLLSLHRTLGNTNAPVDNFALAMWLSTMTLSPDANMALIQSVAMLMTAPTTQAAIPPAAKALSPKVGQDVTYQMLKEIVRNAAVPYDASPVARSDLRRAPYGNRRETTAEHRARCEAAYDRQVATASRDLAQEFRQQWKDSVPDAAKIPKARLDYIDLPKVMDAINGTFNMCRTNVELKQFCNELQSAIATLTTQDFSVPGWQIPPALSATSTNGHVTIDNMFSGYTPQPIEKAAPQLQLSVVSTPAEPICGNVSLNLEAVVNVLEAEAIDQASFKQLHVQELRRSMDALQQKANPPCLDIPTQAELLRHLELCKESVKDVYGKLVKAVELELQKRSGARRGLHWPRVSPSMFLEQLQRDRWAKLSDHWRMPITQYGVVLTALSRAERLLNAAAANNTDDLMRELQNPGHTNWSVLDQPEALLLEVEGGIMIRAVQEEIAREMRSPSTQSNQVIQLNMGEGKSSVIVPMVATALADRTQLVRVIVAKPQSKQMSQMLISKLGGLLNRRVFYMPYSRALKLTESSAKDVERLCKDCQEQAGILLLQPEHILSHKLTGPESFIAGNSKAGEIFLRTQKYFNHYCRDIIDESDENFNVKFELVYTVGLRRPVEFAPNRWALVQQMLDLVKCHASTLAIEDPKTIDFGPRSQGGFPRIRILQENVAQQLLQRVAKDIVEYGLGGLPIPQQQPKVRESLFKYIYEPDLTAEDVAVVEKGPFWTANTRQALLLTRGLLAGGILKFVFCTKRWRVTYGLTTRTPATRLAVPYRAKDSPSPRSEFSHPEAVLLMTSLSYYYGGLEDDDLFTALGHLMTSDQADMLYQVWIADVIVPREYQQLAGINIKDRVLCAAKIFPHLRFSKGAIDYWLSHIVFQREMKEYPHKLSASGCDLGMLKTRPTTCFSGTNDSKALLPLDVCQLSLEQQSHTNALVLEYILGPENGVALMPSPDPALTDAMQLLNMVMQLDPIPEVILDVGAFVLELDNHHVAEAWLEKFPKSVKQAAVYCDENDDVCVINRVGRIELLQTSSFKDRMDLCVVYLDEAHTRGIDLKLPLHWRAACTLGPNLSKDRLVQACMRMRKLGHGQSVVFCVPTEIRQILLRGQSDETHATISVADVVRWSISETYAEILSNMALWTAQGHRFNIQQELWQKNTVNGDYKLTKKSAEEFLEEEARTLNFRYRPKSSKKAPLEKLAKDPKPRSKAIVDRCRLFGMLEFNSRRLIEEQERELSPEVDIDAERVIHKPPNAAARAHCLRKDVISFVLTGEPKQNSMAYGPAFDSLANTSAGQHFNVKQFPPNALFASADFANTIEKPGVGSLYDSYQRSVQWVLTGLGRESTVAKYIMIISPFEAHRLIERDDLLGSSRSVLHLYRPRYNMKYPNMSPLDFYTVSDRPVSISVSLELSVQLNVFSGQLYFSSYEEYTATCKFLGLISGPTQQGWQVAADGFIEKDGSGKPPGSLRSSPVNFLKVLLSKVRGNGDDISKTHMGMLLDGKLFKPSDFA